MNMLPVAPKQLLKDTIIDILAARIDYHCSEPALFNLVQTQFNCSRDDFKEALKQLTLEQRIYSPAPAHRQPNDVRLLMNWNKLVEEEEPETIMEIHSTKEESDRFLRQLQSSPKVDEEKRILPEDWEETTPVKRGPGRP